MKTRKRRSFWIVVIDRPPISKRHGIEVGTRLEAVHDRERRPPVARGGTRGRLKFRGAVWVRAPLTNERVRLLAGEWRHD